jgi:hypothetical protein
VHVFQQSGDRSDAPNVVVLFSDGNPNVEVANTIPENILLKNTGGSTFIVTVSVGAQGFVNFDTLNLLASPPASRNVLSTTRFGWLQNLTSPVLAAICNGKSHFNTFSAIEKVQFLSCRRESII